MPTRPQTSPGAPGSGANAQTVRAERFRALHRGSPALLLPNAWDAASARLLQAAGFPAVATTSGGLAWSLGYPDGEGAPWPEVVAATRRIARVLDIPLSADIESGFGKSPDEVFENVREIIAAGAVGINIEDSDLSRKGTLRPQAEAAEGVRAARRAADASGVPIVINARTDVYQVGWGEARERPDEALRRGQAYLAAGADCIFVFGQPSLAEVSVLATRLNAPVNIVGRPGMPAMEELERHGVARVSTASGVAMAALSSVQASARTLFESRTFDHLTTTVKRADLQEWFNR
jgi:2-methylisocitrate lyase-like PEP mutase family enzyme